ncbi:hypothetical protein JK361_22730 [Streptomyces sp. 5-8]|uniref:Uncharacterized protein n=1 Tax=Streptomyces musisoli TaxID=2802280 RepID=A0ABS1P4U8_9ACTN|nr:hypothetical protein [Streptomyces musisoli]MBL1107386.1 hypothetical protein [Streptomyces musisoli]
MPDTITRRGWLLAAIQRETAPITTQRAAQILAASPWGTAGRNTARKDLRALSSRGFLTAVETAGRRTYFPTTTGEDGRS